MKVVTLHCILHIIFLAFHRPFRASIKHSPKTQSGMDDILCMVQSKDLHSSLYSQFVAFLSRSLSAV